MTLFSPLSKNDIPEEDVYSTPTRFALFLRSPLAVFGLIVLLVLLFSAWLFPIFSHYDYETIALAKKNLSPSFQHWFGTDDLGRDLFIRTCYGVRISFFVALAAAVIDMTLGVLWGGFAAVCGGFTGQVMMRIVDMITALPNMLLVILILVVFKPGVLTVIIALSVTGWLNMARIVRGQVLKVQEEPFIEAARAMGAGPFWLIRRHFIPSLQGTIIVAMTLTIPSAIFTEAFLSFLGLGIQAPKASLGVLASDGVGALIYYPWRLIFPALTLCLLDLSFHCMGHVLSEIFNPRLQTRLQIR